MLAESPKAAQEAVAAAKKRWKALIPAHASEQAGRAADCFAILEAALMLSLPLTEWTATDCRAAVEHSFRSWIAIYGTANRERVQLVEMVSNFLLVNESRFDLIYSDDISQIRATATVVAVRVMVIAETRVITAKAESTETRGMVMRVRKKNMEIVRTQDDPITSSQISTTLLHVNLPSIMALSAISLCRQE